MANNQFLLPDVGEGLTEADIVAWHVTVGDTVGINDIICDIETAKSVVELPSPFAGTVQAILVEVGQTVEVGTPIIEIGDQPAGSASHTGADPAGEGWGGSASGTPDIGEIDLSNPAASGGGEGETLVGRMKADRGPQRRRRRGSATPRTEAGANTQMQVQGAFAPGGALSDPVAESAEQAVPAVAADPSRPAPVAAKALAKPKVRRIARDLGVDLTAVSATGPGGTVTAEDVLTFHAGGTPTVGAAGSVDAAPVEQPPAQSAGTAQSAQSAGSAGSAGLEVREPVKGVRKAMAAAMTSSAFTSPHVTEWITVDVSATMELVDQLRERREFRGVRVTPNLLVAKACLLALRRTPILNSWFDTHAGDNGEVVHRSGVNLGVAAATPRGLMVPNIKGADAMDLRSLGEAMAGLVATAREGRTAPADMAGGTFTLTNVGVFGVDAGTPIINPGESGILAVGAINRRPWVVSDKKGRERLTIRDVTTLALSFDHRHIDGEAGSRFLADVASVLNDPVNGLLL